jgi:hypothetical protein
MTSAQNTSISAAAAQFARQQVAAALKSMKRLRLVYANISTSEILKSISDSIDALQYDASVATNDANRAKRMHGRMQKRQLMTLLGCTMTLSIALKANGRK